MLFPVGFRETIFSDRFAGAGSVDKGLVAGINTDVRVSPALFVEEKQVALLHAPAAYGTGSIFQVLRAVWDVQAGRQIAVAHQPAAIEARGAVARYL